MLALLLYTGTRESSRALAMPARLTGVDGQPMYFKYNQARATSTVRHYHPLHRERSDQAVEAYEGSSLPRRVPRAEGAADAGAVRAGGRAGGVGGSRVRDAEHDGGREEVAVQYAGQGTLPTVFEISCGAIDRDVLDDRRDAGEAEAAGCGAAGECEGGEIDPTGVRRDGQEAQGSSWLLVQRRHEYVQAMEEATRLKEMDMCKIYYWLDSTSEDKGYSVVSEESTEVLYNIGVTLPDESRDRRGGRAIAGGREGLQDAGSVERAVRVSGAGGRESVVNGRSADGSTALHVAAVLGHMYCMQSLVRQDADVNKRDDKGETCAHSASTGGHVEVLRYLEEAGGREPVLQANNDGQTCAHAASRRGHAEAL
eukprot:764006-Hanusia_phi.AAC.4